MFAIETSFMQHLLNYNDVTTKKESFIPRSVVFLENNLLSLRFIIFNKIIIFAIKTNK